MEKCITGKKVYYTLEVAEDALIEAWINFEFGSGKGPVTVYKCDDCGCYHLTSQGKMNAKLERYLSEGKIKREKEARHWNTRLKKR